VRDELPMNIPTKFGSKWPSASGFGKDYVKCVQMMDTKCWQ